MNVTSVAEAKRSGLNPRYRKLKKEVGHAGHPTLKPGTKVLVIDARNQPEWKEKRLVFIEHFSLRPCELLLSLNEGHVNP